MLGIHQALSVLYRTEHEALAWLHGHHLAPVFGGRPPLALVTSGTQDGLMTVRRFLDASCTGLYIAPNEIDEDPTPYADRDIVFQ